MHRNAARRSSRRQFVATLGAAGLALGCAPRLRAAEKSDVIVLGAGLAGLYASMLLGEQGFRVSLLEASDHVGGRVQTRRIGGRLHELGASDIGVMYARVLNMMRELGLKRVPSDVQRIRPFSYHVGGKLLRADEWETADVNRTVGDERAIAPPRLESTLLGRLNPLEQPDDWLRPEYRRLDVPIAQFLHDNGVSDAAIQIIAQTYNGNGVGRTSALAMLRDATRARFGIDAYLAMQAAGQDVAPLSKVAGGNQRLPEAMAAKLGDIVHLHRVAARISQDDSGVEVSCLDGSRWRAAFLVVAMPLTALRRITFSPALSAEKTAAIATLDYYAATKFYLRPTAPFWESDGHEPSMWTDGPVERVFAATEESGDVHTLLVWINGAGSRRIDQLGREGATALVLDTLAEMRPASKGRIEVMDYQAWGREPFSGGCGHSYSAGQVARFADTLPAPEGRIHFAGEHTRRAEFGMESAMASAERVSAELLATAGT